MASNDLSWGTDPARTRDPSFADFCRRNRLTPPPKRTNHFRWESKGWMYDRSVWIWNTLRDYVAGGPVCAEFSTVEKYVSGRGGDVKPRALARACRRFGLSPLYLREVRRDGDPNTAGRTVAFDLLLRSEGS